jgi:hypothetical protein
MAGNIEKDFECVCEIDLEVPAVGHLGAVIQGDQKVCVHLMITVQKTSKIILNSFNHLP